ncbi:hypothetical protein CC79DRAFT_1325518 [Sarocladium strictum]
MTAGVVQEPGGHWEGLKSDRDMITKGPTVAQLMGKMLTKGMQASQLGKPWEKFMEAYPGRASMLLRELSGFVSFKKAGRPFEVNVSDAHGFLKQSVPPTIQLAVMHPNTTKLAHIPVTSSKNTKRSHSPPASKHDKFASTTFGGGNPAWSVMTENIGTNRQTMEKQCISKATSAIKANLAHTRKPHDHFGFFIELQVHDGEDQPPAKRTEMNGQKQVTNGVVDEDIQSSEYPAAKNATRSNSPKGRVTRSRAQGKKNCGKS